MGWEEHARMSEVWVGKSVWVCARGAVWGWKGVWECTSTLCGANAVGLKSLCGSERLS